MGKGSLIKTNFSITKDRYLRKYSLYILLSLLVIMVFSVFSEYIFLEKLYLFKGLASDSLNDTYPNYILISDYLRTDGIPKWSFRQGIGQNIFPFSFPDPFVSLLYLLDRDHLAYGIAYMEIVKIILAGILFFLFLRKRKLSNYVCIAGGLLYSFSSFMIIGSCWNIFSTEVVYLALLLLAFEKLYQDNNWFLFPVAVALIAILQPFDLWLFGVFLFVYMIVRNFEENNNFKKLFPLLLRTGLLALLGVGISSFFFLSEVRIMINSPRIKGDSGYSDDLLSLSLDPGSPLQYLTAAMRLFSSELMGPSNNYFGWYNFMEAPLFYCGLVNLLLVPQLFQFLDSKRKKLYGMWLGFLILPVLIPFLRYSFWLFTGNYYRLYSFFVAFILMFFSIQALHHIIKNKKADRKVLLITLAVLLLALYYPYEFFQKNALLNTRLRDVVALFLVGYSVILFFVRSTKRAFLLQLALLLMVFYELILFSKFNVNERKALTNDEYNQKGGYSDYTNDAVAYLKKIDKGFWRLSKNYSSGPSTDLSLNDAKVQRYRGTRSYHSFNQIHYVRFLAGMNIIDGDNEEQTRWITGLRDTPFLHSYAGVKYLLSKGTNPVVHSNYEALDTIGDVKVFRNKFALPLGFTYDKVISRKDFSSLSPFQKGLVLYNAFILNDSLYNNYYHEFIPFDTGELSKRYSVQEYIKDIQILKKDTFLVSKFSNNHIEGSVAVKEKKMLCFSIPFSEGWSTYIDGKEVTPIRINIGFIGLVIDKGDHSVELSYTPPLFYSGAIISILSILLFIILMIFDKRKLRVFTKSI